MVEGNRKGARNAKEREEIPNVFSFAPLCALRAFAVYSIFYLHFADFPFGMVRRNLLLWHD